MFLQFMVKSKAGFDDIKKLGTAAKTYLEDKFGMQLGGNRKNRTRVSIFKNKDDDCLTESIFNFNILDLLKK